MTQKKKSYAKCKVKSDNKNSDDAEARIFFEGHFYLHLNTLNSFYISCLLNIFNAYGVFAIIYDLYGEAGDMQ